MACVAHELQTTVGHRHRAVPVIADRGDAAAVVLVPMSHEPVVGDRFEYEGMQWVVVRAKDHLRGAVAVPALTRGGL